MSEKFLSITGKVISGDKIARKLGYPTLNLKVPSDLIIKYGVYAGIMEYNNTKYNSIINIGITPNHPQRNPKLETHVFDFNKNLYGEIITIIFVKYIRPEIKFSSFTDLTQQIKQDCLLAQQILANH